MTHNDTIMLSGESRRSEGVEVRAGSHTLSWERDSTTRDINWSSILEDTQGTSVSG